MDRRAPPPPPLTRHERDEAGIFLDAAERLLMEALDRMGHGLVLDTARGLLAAGFWWANLHLRNHP